MRTALTLLVALPFMAGAAVAFVAFPGNMRFAHPHHIAAAVFIDPVLHPEGESSDVARALPVAATVLPAKPGLNHVFRCRDTNGDLVLQERPCVAPDANAETDAAGSTADDDAGDIDTSAAVTQSTETVNAGIADASHGATVMAAAQ